jgi:hypothetical protein
MTLLLLAVCLSVSLRTETLKGSWDSASLRAKTLREIKENMGQWSLRKETLKNRKEARF